MTNIYSRLTELYERNCAIRFSRSAMSEWEDGRITGSEETHEEWLADIAEILEAFRPDERS